MASSEPTQSSSELLMSIMEEFSKDEPLGVLVIWTTENGDLRMKTNYVNSQAIGAAILHGILTQD